MAKSILIGIDAGTTVLKACAFEEGSGRLLSQAAKRLPCDSPVPGASEQSPTLLLRSLYASLNQLRRELGVRWREVRAVGLASQAGSSMLVHRETGAAQTPLVLWNDSRAIADAAQIQQRKPPSFWRTNVGNPIAPAGLGRLAQFQAKQPELFTNDYLHVGAGEYLFFHLTGHWRQDAGHAAQATGLNAPKNQIPPAVLDLLGLTCSFFAPLRRGHETTPLRTLTANKLGLPQGLPVAGPYFDQEASYLAATGPLEHPLQCSLGTSWVGNFRLPAGVRAASPFCIKVPSPIEDGLLMVLPLFAGNAAWDWALQTFVCKNIHTAVKKASALFEQALLPCNGLVALPWLTQPNPFPPHQPGAGLFTGLSTLSTGADMLRAVAAGLAFELWRTLESAAKCGHLDGVALCGGAGKSWYIPQIIAALFESIPVHLLEDPGSAASRGAVYAFSPKTASAKLLPAGKPAQSQQDAIRFAYETYRTVFEQAYGRLPEAQPFSIQTT